MNVGRMANILNKPDDAARFAAQAKKVLLPSHRCTNTHVNTSLHTHEHAYADTDVTSRRTLHIS